MKVVVIKDSVIYNGKIFPNGEVFEAKDSIAENLIKRGYVAIFAEAEEVTCHLDKEQMKEWSYADLKKLASDIGLSAKGTKEELIERICSEEVTVPAEEEPDCEESAGDMPNTSMPE